jgi:HEAT repeat protein
MLLAAAAAAGEIEDLVRQLGDDDFTKREAAVQRLVEIGAEAVPALEKAREAEDAETRARAAIALERIAWQVELPERFRKAHPEATQDIPAGDEASRVAWLKLLARECGADALPAATLFLSDSSRRVRSDALLFLMAHAARLAELREPWRLERLAPALTDPDPGLRALALRAAGEWGRPAGKADALAELVTRAVVPAARLALAADEEATRAAAARALGRLRAREALRELADAAADASPAVRRAAIEALGEIGDPRGADAVSAALLDPSDDVALAALDACRTTATPDAVRRIRELLRQPERPLGVRQGALESLAALDPASAVEESAAYLASDADDLRAAAWRIRLARSLEEAASAIADEAPEVRLVAAAALERATPAQAAALAPPLLDDARSVTLRDARGADLDRSEVRARAIASLEKVAKRKLKAPDADALAEAWKAWCRAGGR